MKILHSLLAVFTPSNSILPGGIASPLLSLGAALMLVQPCAADPFEFELTGNLTKRVQHTMTLLQNGKALVVGGDNADSGTLASAELYDPDIGMWFSTGSLGTARQDHAAALLPNGKVLVTGGDNGGAGPLTSTEIYDPTSGTWNATGNLHVSRVNFTATLLPTGKVLVAGGHHAHVETTSAELYDPDTGTWAVTGNMVAGRNSHTAALLQNGKVLVASGYGGGASCELYDPATGTWSSTGSLSVEREGLTATLLPNGKVLVAGGDSLGSAEFYDPASGTWSTTGNLVYARGGHTATLLQNGKVLVAAGRGPGGDRFGFLKGAELGAASGLTQITPAATTCSQFSSGTAETLANMEYEYSFNNLLITRIAPRAFFYWVIVTAPAGNNIFMITQTITTGKFETLFPLVGNGSNVFDSDCVALQRSITQNGDTVTARFNAPAAGTYFIAIKFNSQTIIGQPRPDPKTVHYDFTTTDVPDSTSGLDLVLHPKPSNAN